MKRLYAWFASKIYERKYKREMRAMGLDPSGITVKYVDGVMKVTGTTSFMDKK